MEIRSQKLISDDIRNAELWFPLYHIICQNKKLRPDSILNEINPSKNNIDSWKGALEDLQLLNVINKNDSGFYITPLVPPLEKLHHPLSETAFKVWILRLIRDLSMDPDSNDYTRQGHLLLTFRYLIENDIRYLNKNDQVPLGNISDYYEKCGLDVHLNPQKTSHIVSVATYLGLGYRVTGGISMAFDPDVFYEILKAIAMGEESKKISLDRFFIMLDSFFKIFPTGSSGVNKECFPIIGQAFFWQQKLNHIRLSSHGDSASYRFSDSPLYLTYNDIEVIF